MWGLEGGRWDIYFRKKSFLLAIIKSTGLITQQQKKKDDTQTVTIDLHISVQVLKIVCKVVVFLPRGKECMSNKNEKPTENTRNSVFVLSYHDYHTHTQTIGSLCIIYTRYFLKIY